MYVRCDKGTRQGKKISSEFRTVSTMLPNSKQGGVKGGNHQALYEDPGLSGK